MRSIRAGSGLGDSIYLQSVVRHLLLNGEALTVCSNWPDVFRPLADRISIEPFRRAPIDITAHYVRRKGAANTDQFEDCCLSAGITDRVDLKIDWTISNPILVEKVLKVAAGRPIVLVQLPRSPMGRRDGFGAELLPRCETIQSVLDIIRDRACLVQVGSGEPLHRFEGLHLDMAGKTRVAELFDMAKIASACVGYVSLILPLAESLGLKTLLVWSRRGLRAPQSFIRQITPQKVIHRKDLVKVIFDDAAGVDVTEAAHALLE